MSAWLRELWGEARFPLLASGSLGVVACPLVLVLFGTGGQALMFASFIGGSCLAVPLLIVGLCRCVYGWNRVQR